MKKTVAVLLTVFNRKEVTLRGLDTLYAAMKPVEGEYSFDVYMTDDGCTDGTPEAVKERFPDIHIVQGDGTLYWSGGMRKAWDAARKDREYDYYLWFNDDAELYENALRTLFDPITEYGDNVIVSGAFVDHNGKVSYGVYDRNFKLMEPKSKSGALLLNGNLVLISQEVMKKTGLISDYYLHSGGDWDYGCRALKSGINIRLTDAYVGITDRHDADLKPFLDCSKSLHERLQSLQSTKCDARRTFHFNYEHISKAHAFKVILLQYTYAICPGFYYLTHKKRCHD